MGNMAPRQKLRAGRALVGFPNTAPVVVITTFTSPVTVDAEAEVGSFVATAVDAEQGDLASTLVWTTKTVVAGEGSQIVDVGGEGSGDATGLAADTAGSQAVDYGSAVTGGTATGLDSADTAGTQVVDVGGAVTGGTLTGLDAADTAGSQAVDFGAAVSGASATGLTNDATVFTATVNPDGGGAQAIAVTGSAAQTFTTLITELDLDTTGASWSIIGGDLVCTSDTTGTGSSILIVDTDLFAGITGFVSVLGAVAGTTSTLTATVNPDSGGNQALSVNGEDAATFAALIIELDLDTTGASWSIVGGNLVCTSATTGGNSSISILDTNLFSTMPLFSSILAATVGTTTTFTASVNPNGSGVQPISILGEGATTFTELITELDLDTTGGTWSIIGGDLVCTSTITGVSSSILIADTDLFVGVTNFAGILSAVAGTTTVYTATIAVDGGEGQAISVVGDDAQTYTQLVSELNLDTIGAFWDLSGGGSTDGPRAISDSAGVSSSISIGVGTLFPALLEFDVLLAAVPGTAAVFGVVGTGAQPPLTFPLVGAQVLTATATDSFSATGFDTQAVTVNPPV
jgi:hypothetical protein